MTYTKNDEFFKACIIVLVLFSCIAGPACGSVYLKNGTEIGEDTAYITILQDPNTTAEPVTVHFFYNTHCGACHSSLSFLDEYRKTNPDIVITYYDLFNSTENRELFEGLKAEYNRQYASVPIIFMGNAVLEGNYAIRTNLDPLVKGYAELNGKGFSLPSILPSFSVLDPVQGGTGPGIPPVICAGLLDGVSPCAFTALAILLVFILSLGTRQKIVLAGIVYSAAVFFMCFLSGVGIFTFILPAGMAGIFNIFPFVVAVIAVIAGILVIKDALNQEKESLTAEPDVGEGTVCRYVKRSTIPLAFVLGVLAGIFVLPCTGEVHHAILQLISSGADVTQGLYYLLIYIFSFIIPLIMVTALVGWLLNPERINGLCTERKRAIQIITGCILFLFAAIILAGLF